MSSTSAAEKAVWLEGDCCLAPNPRDGILRRANIRRLTSTSHDDEDTVWVIFSSDEEEEEEAIPVSKLTRPGSISFTQEKPVFPGSVADLKLCIPLNLSHEDTVPYTINRYLRDYQREGIKFIYDNYIHATGCILGDDMGLGKTVQVIGFLAAVLHKTGTWEDVENNRPLFLQSQTPSKPTKPSRVFLLVAPLSVLYNWKDELDTWGYFQCVVVHGLRKEEELARINKGRIEIALTTYETLRLCLDHFNKIDWSAVIVDEAHKIKNPNSQITQAMKTLRCKIRIGLTGTILQNNLEELWCVMDWAIPGCLGNLGQFKSKFSGPIEQGQRHSATKRALATGRKTVKALVRKISRWFFRRTKALIKEQLPKKDDRVVFCSLTDFQQTVYQTVLDTEDVTLLLRSSEKCDCQSGRTRKGCCYKTNSEGVQMKELYFSYLTILRKVANHAALLQSTPGTSKNQEKYVGSICTKVFQKFPDFVQRCKNEAFEALSDPTYSGKMKVLQKLLKYYLQRKDKVLIFSLSTKLLDVLESYCMAEGLDYSRLDGATKSKDRVQIVRDFNSSSHVNLCLVSTLAGGLGLNFVGANVVFLFDPTWNPANDLQAVDRAYRIGQCRDVTVLRLISLGTVEEVIYLRQVYKQQLQSSVVGEQSARRYFEAVQGHAIHKGELFGMKNLFRLQTRGMCLTHRILEREGQVEAGVMTTRTHRGDEKEEEEAKRDGDPGDFLTNGPAPDNEMSKDDRNAAKMPRGVLDFSSESETEEELPGLERKASNLGADDGNKSGKATTNLGQMSLLQYGFSGLLEGVKDKSELEGGDSSSSAEENFIKDDPEDKKLKGAPTGTPKTSSRENIPVCLSRRGAKDCDTSIGAARKHGDRGEKFPLKDGGYIIGRGKGVTHKRGALDEESDERKKKSKLPKMRHLDGCSDESEDLDLEAKEDTFISKNRRENNKKRKQDVNKRRQSASMRDRSKYTKEIETFTSSEDELAAPPAGRRAGVPGGVSFTSLKRRARPAYKETIGNIDSLLGGVQEVVFTHSNQRVVGGSKAEELISRAAVRDVFERKMYSQFPANHLLGTQETLSGSQPDGPLCSAAAARLQRPAADHPVTFTKQSVHHKGGTAVIIGETPKAIRRQQLEEMSGNFKFPSTHQFAVEILRRDSTQRLSWLRQYYTSMNQPDLHDAVIDNFSEPVLAQTSSSSTATSSPSSKTSGKKRCTKNKNQPMDPSRATRSAKDTQANPEPRTKPAALQSNVLVPQIRLAVPHEDVVELPKEQKTSEENGPDPLQDVPGARGHKRTKKGKVSGSGGCKAHRGLVEDLAFSSGPESAEAAAFPNHADQDPPSSSNFHHCSPAVLSKPMARGSEQDQKSSARSREASQEESRSPRSPPVSRSRSFLTDLIGDTSILDDLLKPKAKSTQQGSTPEIPTTSSSSPSTRRVTACGRETFLSDPSSHTQTTHQLTERPQTPKGNRKDIWDILNEGNEESINRLTDPEEVQRVCIKTNLGARIRSEQREGRSLWKTNEKFLWKK